MYQYDLSKLLVRVYDQEVALLDKTKAVYCPLIVKKELYHESEPYFVKKYISVDLLDNNKNILKHIEPNDMTGEFNWFFKHPQLFPSQNKVTPIITTSLSSLSQAMTCNAPIEHKVYKEIIGGASEIYSDFWC
jgi:hypothetical protein